MEERKRGCYIKFFSWFNNKEIQLAIRNCFFSSGDKLSTQKLAQTIGKCLSLKIVKTVAQNIFEQEITFKLE